MQQQGPDLGLRRQSGRDVLPLLISVSPAIEAALADFVALAREPDLEISPVIVLCHEFTPGRCCKSCILERTGDRSRM